MLDPQRELSQRLIVGLGNPGPTYSRTRHNAGFMLIDRLIDRWCAKPVPSARQFLLWQCVRDKARVFLMKPLTFMNLSGNAVAEFLQELPMDRDKMMIAYDDIALDLGQIRIRAKGSDGGQKGLRHIGEVLGTAALTRLRLGIGPQPDNISRVDYVLMPFSDSEWIPFNHACHRGCEAMEDWLKVSLQIVMSRYNAKVPLE